MPELKPELVERMERLVRSMANPSAPILHAAPTDYKEARAIVAELPAPVDPDLIEARRVVVESFGPATGLGPGPDRVRAIKAGEGDDYWEMRAALAAIKRGRQLAQATQ